MRAEVLYLEVARGRGGVPALYGGWIDQERVYVVQRVSASLVWRDPRRSVGRPRVAALVEAVPRRSVEAARALLERFRSLTDAGYHMEDPHGSQFTPNDAARSSPSTRRSRAQARPSPRPWTGRSGGPKTPPGGPTAPGRREELFPDDDCVRTSDGAVRAPRLHSLRKRARERRGAGAAGRTCVGWTRARLRPGDADGATRRRASVPRRRRRSGGWGG